MMVTSFKQLTCFCTLSKSYLLYPYTLEIIYVFQWKCLFLISGSQSPLSLLVKFIHAKIWNMLLAQEEFLKMEIITYFENWIFNERVGNRRALSNVCTIFLVWILLLCTYTITKATLLKITFNWGWFTSSEFKSFIIHQCRNLAAYRQMWAGGTETSTSSSKGR